MGTSSGAYELNHERANVILMHACTSYGEQMATHANSVLLVKWNQDERTNYVELHVIGEIPGPAHTL